MGVSENNIFPNRLQFHHPAMSGLQFQEDLLTQIMRTSPDLVFFKDLELRYYAFSDAFLKFNGFTKADIYLKTLGEIIGDDALAHEYEEKDREIIRSGIPSREEAWMMGEEGHSALFDIIVSPVKDSEGNTIGLLGIGREITEIFKVQSEVNAKNAELLKSSSELDGLVYKAAHDLRAPLSNLLGLNTLITRTKTPEELARLVELQQAQLRRMDEFICEIVDLTRNKRLEVELVEINIEEIWQSTWEELKHLRGADRVKFHLQVEGPSVIQGDPIRFPIIFHNLLANAIVFQDMEKFVALVRVKVVVESHNIRVRVEDNGIGMSEEVIPHIFEMFYRASSQSLGSGLGLYITKDAVAKMGGTISVASEPGTGSVFEVVLPISISESSREGAGNSYAALSSQD